jgi:hypothetical protein
MDACQTSNKTRRAGKKPKANTVQLSMLFGRMSIPFSRGIWEIETNLLINKKCIPSFYKNADRFCCQTVLNGLLYELAKL